MNCFDLGFVGWDYISDFGCYLMACKYSRLRICFGLGLQKKVEVQFWLKSKFDKSLILSLWSWWMVWLVSAKMLRNQWLFHEFVMILILNLISNEDWRFGVVDKICDYAKICEHVFCYGPNGLVELYVFIWILDLMKFYM